MFEVLKIIGVLCENLFRTWSMHFCLKHEPQVYTYFWLSASILYFENCYLSFCSDCLEEAQKVLARKPYKKLPIPTQFSTNLGSSKHQQFKFILTPPQSVTTVAYFDYFHCVHTFFVKFQIKYLRYFILALHVIYNKYPSYI